jgi:LysR family pca operon transcriptional activator
MNERKARRAPAADFVAHVLKQLKLRHLSCALDIARLGSVKEAAEALCVSESAVSKTLRELEEQLGVRLFERSAKGMLPTASGRQFINYAHSALNTLQAGVAVASGRSADPARAIRIGAMAVVSATFLPGIVSRFLVTEGDTRVEIASGSGEILLSRLRAGDVDLVLGRCPPLDTMSGLDFEQLYTDRHIFVVRAAHPLADLRTLAPSRIATYPIVMPPRQSLFWQEIHHLFLARGVKPRAAQVEVLDLQFCRTFTLRSDAVWIASERVVTSDLDAGLLVRLPIDSPRLEVPVGIITRHSGTLDTQVRRLIALIRASRDGPSMRDIQPASP